MSSPEALKSRLVSAATLTEIIAASRDAFEYIRRCANELAIQVTGNFPAWASAAAPACDGRDALGRAPSMPHATASAGPAPTIATTDENIAAGLVAELAALLDERLAAAAEQAEARADAKACQRASRAGAEIRGLFPGA